MDFSFLLFNMIHDGLIADIVYNLFLSSRALSCFLICSLDAAFSSLPPSHSFLRFALGKHFFLHLNSLTCLPFPLFPSSALLPSFSLSSCRPCADLSHVTALRWNHGGPGGGLLALGDRYGRLALFDFTRQHSY